MAKMKHRAKKFSVNGSPLDAILKCIQLERNDSGRRLVWRFRGSKLEVVPLRRSREMLLLGPAIIDASYKRSLKGKFATALTVRGTLGKGKKKKKVVIRVKSKGAVKRYGYIHLDWDAPAGVNTRREALRAGRRELHKRFLPKQELTIQHPGIPTLRRWDAMKVYLPAENLNLICFVSEVRHSVAPGDYNMEITVRFTDPYVELDRDKVAVKKCKAAKKRKRKLSSRCKKLLRNDRKQSHKQDQRADPET